MAAYRNNLLEHIGTVSSFKVRVDRPAFPKCYESMADVWSLARAERFQVMPEECFRPCNGTPMCTTLLTVAHLSVFSDLLEYTDMHLHLECKYVLRVCHAVLCCAVLCLHVMAI